MKYDVAPKIHHEVSIISFHALSIISNPQTLKLMGYIKHRELVFLVDTGSTQNLNHGQVVVDTHYYVHLVHNFQIMISNGGTMKSRGNSENMKL